MLAFAIFVEKHRNSLSDSEKSAIEDKWISRWKDKIGQPTRTPRQVMRAYCVLSWTTFCMTRHVPDLQQTHSNSHLLLPLPHPLRSNHRRLHTGRTPWRHDT